MLQKIDPKTLTMNPFTLIGDQWLLITAGTPEHCNTMTASWGGVGVMWAEPSATCYIRPQRYTKEFVDAHDTFTLSFFDGGWRKQLSYLGTVSGRDEDKVAKAGLTPAFDQAGPYFEEASLVFVCRKAYVQAFEEGCFVDRSQLDRWYPERDLHTMYVGLVEKVLVKE